MFRSPPNSKNSFEIASKRDGIKPLAEVVREGLRLLELQERDRDAAHSALKSKLRLAATQADWPLVDGEEFIGKLIERLRRDSNKLVGT